jgi:hypothetical protein
MVAGAARRRLTGRTAQMLGQLGAKCRLDDPASQPRQQPARACDLLELKTIQCLLESSPGNRPARRSVISGGGL